MGLEALSWQQIADRRLQHLGDAFLEATGCKGVKAASKSAPRSAPSEAQPAARPESPAVVTPQPTAHTLPQHTGPVPLGGRKAKRQFLSGRHAPVQAERDRQQEEDELGKLQAEVHRYGSESGHGNGRSAYAALSILQGSKGPQNGQKINAKHGKGLWMAKRKRDAAAVTEALDAGLVTHKQRALYASDLFDRHRLYGVAVRKARHPQLVAYIAQATEGLKASIVARTVEKVAVSVNSPEGRCLERHIVQLRVPTNLATTANIDWGELEAGLRASLLKLQNLNSSLPVLPEGCTFEILAEQSLPMLV
ncbi:hypothetical protein WJX73_001281 [Symbiochloris irregularis]|uniref:HORMA domain-containing protein n=1 Tax=Symbiochloris irregularis TaxID=706552 RepID=A0AAW1PK55_9CHLO